MPISDLVAYLGYYNTMKIYGFFDYQIDSIINSMTVRL